jgi:hypothetical protein
MMVLKWPEECHDGKRSFAPKSTKSDESRVTKRGDEDAGMILTGPSTVLWTLYQKSPFPLASPKC